MSSGKKSFSTMLTPADSYGYSSYQQRFRVFEVVPAMKAPLLLGLCYQEIFRARRKLGENSAMSITRTRDAKLAYSLGGV